MMDREMARGCRRRPTPTLVLAGVLSLVWLVTTFTGNWLPSIISWVNAAAFASIITVHIWRCSRIEGLKPPVRRFWRHVAVATGTSAAGIVLDAFDSLSNPGIWPAPVSAPAGLTHLASMLAVLWALLRLPSVGVLSRSQRWRFVQDALIVVLTACLFTWYLHSTPSDGSAFTPADFMLTVVACMVVFGFFKVATLGSLTIDRRVLRILSLNLAVAVLAMVLTPLLQQWPNLSDARFVVGLNVALLVWALRTQHRIAAEGELATPGRRRAISMLPYVAVAATDILLIFTAAHGGTEAVVVAVAAVALTAIVVHRQINAGRDNTRLLHQVEATLQELQTTQEQLAHQAQHDHLTNLPNRRLYENHASQALMSSEPTQVALIDLDDFKQVNDRLGHQVGDGLLQAFAERLQSCVRPHDTASRFGGDEFALLLRDVSPQDADGVLLRLRRVLNEPVIVEGHHLQLGCSIGVAAAEPGLTSVELLRRADIALYVVKDRGKGQHVWYHPDQETHAIAKAAEPARPGRSRTKTQQAEKPVTHPAGPTEALAV
jgi:diguanylate cyclase (GGDEF)-like protein